MTRLPGDARAESSRVFVALVVPDVVAAPLAAALASVRDRHPELTWTRPDGWHLTVAFVGSVPVAELDGVRGTVARALAAAPVGRTSLTVATAGRFGGRVLWLGVDDDPPGAVARLGGCLQAALADAGLPVERREVRPHVTLARGRPDRPVREVDVAEVDRTLEGCRVRGGDARRAPDAVDWDADEVVLLRSVRTGGAARYEAVDAWALTSGPEA